MRGSLTMLGCGITIRPPSGWLANVAMAGSIPPPSWMSTAVTVTPSDGATAWPLAAIATLAALSEPNSTADPAQVGRGLLEHPQPLAAYRRLEILEAGDVATRSRQTADKTAGDWVGDLGEHDRDRAGRG